MTIQTEPHTNKGNLIEYCMLMNGKENQYETCHRKRKYQIII